MSLSFSHFSREQFILLSKMKSFIFACCLALLDSLSMYPTVVLTGLKRPEDQCLSANGVREERKGSVNLDLGQDGEK